MSHFQPDAVTSRGDTLVVLFSAVVTMCPSWGRDLVCLDFFWSHHIEKRLANKCIMHPGADEGMKEMVVSHTFPVSLC